MSKFLNLEKVLDEIFGIFSDDEKVKILNAAEKDFRKLVKADSDGDVSVLIETFNVIFNKRSRIISKKVANKYREILRYYSLDDVKQAMSSAKDDDFHRENGYKYCTLEYFSRIEQIDKWINIQQVEEKNTFVAPKFNVKG
jgi:hypothetical protein